MDWNDNLQAWGIVILTIMTIVLLLTLPTMWLWNWLMPVIFGLPEIGFWQAFGLLILSNIFFKNSSSKSN